MAKDAWNKFVKDNAHQSNKWWLKHYHDKLEVGGLTARQWDHYDRIKRLSGVTQQITHDRSE